MGENLKIIWRRISDDLIFLSFPECAEHTVLRHGSLFVFGALLGRGSRRVDDVTSSVTWPCC